MNKELKNELIDLAGNFKFGTKEYRLIQKIGDILTPPTSEEVCKALCKTEGRGVYFKNNNFYTSHDNRIVTYSKYKNITLHHAVPSKTFEIIGRFYQNIKEGKWT